MATKNKLLTVLSEAEQYALYGWPGYTTLQTLISEALSAERRRLGELLAEVLDGAAKNALAQLIVRDDTLSELAALKQDAKDFGWRQMAQERAKRARLEPL